MSDALTRTSERVVVVTSTRPSPFIRELTEEPSERDLVAPPVGTAVRTAAAKAPSPGRDVFVAGSVVAGPGLVLVDQGAVIERHLKKSRITSGDILEAAREKQGLERMDQSKYAVVERTGSISIIPKESAG